MHSFSKRNLRLIAFCMILVAINGLLTFVLGRPGAVSRIVAHDVVESDKKYDYIVIGSSEAMYSIDPKQFRDLTGHSCGIVGTPSATIGGGVYASFLNLIDNKQADTLVLMVGYRSLFDEYEFTETPTAYCINAPYLKRLSARIKYFVISSMMDDNWLERAFIWKDLNNGDPKNNVKTKLSKEYLDYSPDCINTVIDSKVGYDKTSFVYAGDGHLYLHPDNPFNVYDSSGIEPHNVDSEKEYEIDWNKANTYTVSAINDISDYCRKTGTRLIITMAPVPEQTYYNEDYRKATYAYELLSKERGFEFYDINMMKESYYDPSPDCFFDEWHVNGKGAAVFTNGFSQLIKTIENGENEKELFLSWQEVCDREEHAIKQSF